MFRYALLAAASIAGNAAEQLIPEFDLDSEMSLLSSAEATLQQKSQCVVMALPGVSFFGGDESWTNVSGYEAGRKAAINFVKSPGDVACWYTPDN